METRGLRLSLHTPVVEKLWKEKMDKLKMELPTVQGEIAELQQRLADLTDRSRCLEQQIQQEEQQLEAEELEGSVLRSCTWDQLRDMGQTLQDLVTSENRTQISVSPSPSTLRLALRTHSTVCQAQPPYTSSGLLFC